MLDDFFEKMLALGEKNAPKPEVDLGGAVIVTFNEPAAPRSLRLVAGVNDLFQNTSPLTFNKIEPLSKNNLEIALIPKTPIQGSDSAVFRDRLSSVVSDLKDLHVEHLYAFGRKIF